MRSKQITEINVYHTPDKSSKPDLKHQSHLKTTIPSVQQVSSEPKQFSNFAVHRSKMRNYEDLEETPQIYSEKRASKNQWQLKEKVDEYETQISLLRQYLRSCRLESIQKNSISRIFGFPQQLDSLGNEQQRVIRQLGSKVRGLVKQNQSLKHQNAHYSQLNIDEIIQQNQKLRVLLHDYKVSDDNNHKKLGEQNELLKDEIYRVRLDCEEKLRTMEENEMTISYLRANQSELVRQIQVLELKSQQNLRETLAEGDKMSAAKLKQIQASHQKQLLDQQNFWKKQLEDQQQYYQRAKSQIQQTSKEYYSRTHNQQITKLKQYYANAIQDMETDQKRGFQRINRNVDELEMKLNQTNQSISHLKFERDNRMQSTIKKSHNIAFSSTKPQGQVATEQPLIEQLEEEVQVNTKPLRYSINPKMSTHQADILNQKIIYLQKEVNQLKTKLNLSDRLVGDKTEKIIILQNEIKNLNAIIGSLNYNLSQVKSQVLVKEVFKEVPVPAIPKQYSDEVKNIKDTIISCNLANFDIFQNEFNEIIDQRNQLNERMMTLKKEAKQSSKILILEKHLKIERERNKQLEQNLKKYEKEIADLRIQVIQLKNEIESIQSRDLVNEPAGEGSRVSFEHLPDGKAGLEWQKVVKHCLLTSINRLQSLQNRMKQDMTLNK